MESFDLVLPEASERNESQLLYTIFSSSFVTFLLPYFLPLPFFFIPHDSQRACQQTLEQYKRQLNKANVDRRHAMASADAMRSLLQKRLDAAQVIHVYALHNYLYRRILVQSALNQERFVVLVIYVHKAVCAVCIGTTCR